MRPRHDSWFEQPESPMPPGLETLFGDILKAFSQTLPAFGAAGGLVPSAAVRPPVVDVREDADGYVVEAELPGLAREQLQIEFADGTLTLAGAWPAGPDVDDTGTLHRRERPRGPFRRELRFALPIDGHAVVADFANGLLTVRLPKAPEARARSIPVDGSEPGPELE